MVATLLSATVNKNSLNVDVSELNNLIDHINRVRYYYIQLALDLGVDESCIEKLSIAAFIHDIGKLFLDRDILYKTNALTDDEYEHIQQHTSMIGTLLTGSLIPKDIIKIAAEHHENFNGAGYPCGIKGEEISKEGRILRIADVFDALTSDRIYRGNFDINDSLRMMELEDGVYDPHFFNTFKEVTVRRLDLEKGPLKLRTA